MRTRVITAVVAWAVFIPLLLIGGVPFNVLVFAMGIVGMSEFLIMKKELIVSVEALLSFIGIAVLLAPGQCAGFLPKNVTTLDAFYFVMLALLIYTVFSKNRISFDDAGVTALGCALCRDGLSFDDAGSCPKRLGHLICAFDRLDYRLWCLSDRPKARQAQTCTACQPQQDVGRVNRRKSRERNRRWPLPCIFTGQVCL